MCIYIYIIYSSISCICCPLPLSIFIDESFLPTRDRRKYLHVAQGLPMLSSHVPNIYICIYLYLYTYIIHRHISICTYISVYIYTHQIPHSPHHMMCVFLGLYATLRKSGASLYDPCEFGRSAQLKAETAGRGVEPKGLLVFFSGCRVTLDVLRF